MQVFGEPFDDMSPSVEGRNDGGGDRTRTCKPARAAVFKTAALPIMLPLRNWPTGNIQQCRVGAQPGDI